MNSNIEQKVLLCECGSSEHQVIMRYFPDDKPSEVYVDIHLTKRSLWYRIGYAIKYIFGYKSKYGAWDEVILTSAHVKDLQEIVNYLTKSNQTSSDDGQGVNL